MFERMGWTEFVNTRDPVSERFVRLFYANLHCKDTKKPLKSHSSIDGMVFKINTKVIRNAFNIPKGSFRCYESNWWPRVVQFDPLVATNLLTDRTDITTARKPLLNVVTIEVRLVHKQVVHVLALRSGSITWMTFYDVFLVWCVLTGSKMDLSHIIVSHMLKASVDPCSALPYSNHLGKIFDVVGLVLPLQSDNGRGINMIGKRSLGKMNYELLNGKWVVVQGKASANRARGKKRHISSLPLDTTDEDTTDEDDDVENNLQSDDNDDKSDDTELPREGYEYESSEKDSSDEETINGTKEGESTPTNGDDADIDGEAKA
ncbi:hypothetical protein Scep_026139 [Stephania cephalantha]|uniref:Putative plant transposon protein domain-containing protein n=1 Tax=Stephania cephalantha TaxID=152367 RepID=A0AAP0EM32_9MAGN